ncbi:MAG TPA: zinc ABC transporter substrate-binding protein [Solirubrobacteraceae bacterium]|nr:zinc ABC transporter substrate-binding protein [Solirubrobacteraceae bacterium]
MKVAAPTRGPLSKARQNLLAAVFVASLITLLAGCGSNAPSSSSSGKLQVVAAENFWGSIAVQLGGEKVAVASIITNPDTDPHSYEPTAADGVTIARSQMAIVNGIGYDNWASKLLAANPSSERELLNVGRLLGLQQADNPHQWYSPTSVQRVIGQITADYQRLDPKDAAYFNQRRVAFQTQSLAQYNHLRSEIRARYAGTPVGYSESIFQPLGQSLGLKLMTPYSFAKAIAEGADVSAEDKQTVDRQAEDHAIKVWVYNSQNVTPDVQRVSQLASAAHIPTVTVTETLSPASASFEQWQTAQLSALRAALNKATGR